MDVDLYVDQKNFEEISEFLGKQESKKRMRKILIVVLQNLYVDALYRKEGFSKKTKDITAMKFKGSSNPRIYCQEYFPGGNKKIVMIYLLANKDFQRNNKKIIPKLESIADYEYNFN